MRDGGTVAEVIGRVASGETIQRGFRYGAIAWIAGVGLASGIVLATGGGVGEGGAVLVDALQVAVAYYYAMHPWPVLFDPGFGAGLVFVPGLLLVLAGDRLVWTAGIEGLAAGARAGATVVVGYAALALPSLAAVPLTVPAGPSALAVIYLVTGVAVPLVFGALGGLFGALLR